MVTAAPAPIEMPPIPRLPLVPSSGSTSAGRSSVMKASHLLIPSTGSGSFQSAHIEPWPPVGMMRLTFWSANCSAAPHCMNPLGSSEPTPSSRYRLGAGPPPSGARYTSTVIPRCMRCESISHRSYRPSTSLPITVVSVMSGFGRGAGGGSPAKRLGEKPNALAKPIIEEPDEPGKLPKYRS